MAQHKQIDRLPALLAMARAVKNKFRRYPSPEKGGDRLYPMAAPEPNPSFEIAEKDTIFTIGSCFARNVEKALQKAGKTVVSADLDLGPIGDEQGSVSTYFNKYSIHSVYNELKWALERETFPGKEILYPLDDGRFCDPQLGLPILDHPIDEVLEFRHAYLDAMAKVAEADVVIVTLGYVETWYDTKLDLYLNIAPPAAICKKDPERFEFRVLSYTDVLNALNDLHALLLKHRTKPLKMLVTVSPVPLLATFRPMDVLVANSYSKAVQRAAIDEFTMGKDGVDYFPSYEFVALSDPNYAFGKKDYRHVSREIVERIMDTVLSRYIPEPDDGKMTEDKLTDQVRSLSQKDEAKAVVELTEANRELADKTADVLMMEANMRRKLDDIDGTLLALEKAIAVDPSRPVPLERRIMLCRPLRQIDETRELLKIHAERFPARGDFREKVNWA